MTAASTVTATGLRAARRAMASMAARSARSEVRYAYERLIGQRLEAAHDDALAGLEAPADLDEVVVAETGRHLAHLDALARKHEHDAAAAAVRHGAARHDGPAFATLADQRDLDEHAGPQTLLAVVD